MSDLTTPPTSPATTDNFSQQTIQTSSTQTLSPDSDGNFDDQPNNATDIDSNYNRAGSSLYIITDPVADCITRSRLRLQSKSIYLGNECLKTKLAWYHTSSGDILIEEQKTETKQGDSPELSQPLTPAILSAIVYLTDDDFWLSSDGFWKGDSQMAKHLSDVKITCTGTCPKGDSLVHDFANTLRHVQDTMNEKLTENYLPQGIRVNSAIMAEPKIKFRHILFEKITSRLEDIETFWIPDAKGKATMIDISNWPTNTEQAHNAIQNMQTTHRVLPLKAFGIDGRLINPREYRERLRGALVEMRFSMKHWAIPSRRGKKGIDSFVADIQGIRVLQDPPPIPRHSPSKKRIRNNDPFDEDSDNETNKRWRIQD